MSRRAGVRRFARGQGRKGEERERRKEESKDMPFLFPNNDFVTFLVPASQHPCFQQAASNSERIG